MPEDAHPMTLFSQGVMALQTSSKFAAAYQQGVHKSKYWEPVYEDSMDLIAKLPTLAAAIYRCAGAGVGAAQGRGCTAPPQLLPGGQG